MENPEPKQKACKNCGEVLRGAFCHACGQSSRDPRISLRAWLRVQVTEVLSLETSLFRTIWSLLFRPGYLTREWVDGKRARYVSPLRLLLLVSAVLLALTFFVGFFALIDLPAASDLAGTEHGLAYQAAQDAFEGDVRGLLFGGMILLVPLLAVVVRVVNMGTGTYFVDHVVFSLHFFAVVVVLFGLAWIATPLAPAARNPFLFLQAAALLTAVHFVLALRSSWRLSPSSTVVRSAGVAMIVFPLLPVGYQITARVLEPAFQQWITAYRDAVALPAYERWKRAAAEDPDSDQLLREAYQAHLQVRVFETTDPLDMAHLIEMRLASGDDPRSLRWSAMEGVKESPYNLLALGWAAEVMELTGDSLEARKYLERFSRAYDSRIGSHVQEYPLHIEDLERFRLRAAELDGSADPRPGPGGGRDR